MNLELKGTDLEKYLEAATLQALGEHAKDALIKEVVRHLVTTTRDYNGTTKSPLMTAMQSASVKVAEQVIRDKMENDSEFTDAIRGLYEEAIKRFLDAETREKLISKMADRLTRAFSEDRY